MATSKRQSNPSPDQSPLEKAKQKSRPQIQLTLAAGTIISRHQPIVANLTILPAADAPAEETEQLPTAPTGSCR